MDGVIALCHFCENHGPSVMFCCEKCAEPTLNRNADVVEAVDVFTPCKSLESNGFTVGSFNQKSELSRQSSTSSNANASSKARKTNLCQACQSIPEEHNGYISHDPNRGESFISSQHPTNSHVFSKVRQACVRSLSGEVCPGREGPIFFGDDKDGYVLSYTFFVEDSKARGFKRWYSIIVVMMDRIFLIQSWMFFVESIEKIKNYLQRSALNVYKSEEKECPQRPARLISAYRRTQDQVLTPQNFRQNRGGTSNARALVQLTGDQNLYVYMHTVFTWMMRTSKLRLKEITPCTNEKRDTLRSISLSTQGSFDSDKGEILSPLEELPKDTNFTFVSLRHMREVLETLPFKCIAWNALIGNQIIWRGPNHIVSSALHILKDILPFGCVKMVLNSQAYLDYYEANFLGLNQNVEIPKHVFQNEKFVLIDVLLKAQPRIKQSRFFPAEEKLGLSEVEFKMQTSSSPLPERFPNLLNKVEVALANDKLSETVVQHVLLCLKEEWLNNAKILYKVKKVDNRSTEDTNEILYSCMQCNEEDVKLLKFWMVGLDRHFKGDLTSKVLRNKS